MLLRLHGLLAPVGERLRETFAALLVRRFRCRLVRGVHARLLFGEKGVVVERFAFGLRLLEFPSLLLRLRARRLPLFDAALIERLLAVGEIIPCVLIGKTGILQLTEVGIAVHPHLRTALFFCLCRSFLILREPPRLLRFGKSLHAFAESRITLLVFRVNTEIRVKLVLHYKPVPTLGRVVAPLILEPRLVFRPLRLACLFGFCDPFRRLADLDTRLLRLKCGFLPRFTSLALCIGALVIFHFSLALGADFRALDRLRIGLSGGVTLKPLDAITLGILLTALLKPGGIAFRTGHILCCVDVRLLTHQVLAARQYGLIGRKCIGFLLHLLDDLAFAEVLLRNSAFDTVVAITYILLP